MDFVLNFRTNIQNSACRNMCCKHLNWMTAYVLYELVLQFHWTKLTECSSYQLCKYIDDHFCKTVPSFFDQYGFCSYLNEYSTFQRKKTTIIVLPYTFITLLSQSVILLSLFWDKIRHYHRHDNIWEKMISEFPMWERRRYQASCFQV